jgi:hypothetical protein
MTYFKGTALSFIVFSLCLYFTMLHPGSLGSWLPVYIIIFLIVYAVCFATEISIQIAEAYWYGKKMDWLSITAAILVSFPFWASPVLSVSIFTGAFGFYIGRKLPNNRLTLGLVPLPAFLLFTVILPFFIRIPLFFLKSFLL